MLVRDHPLPVELVVGTCQTKVERFRLAVRPRPFAAHGGKSEGTPLMLAAPSVAIDLPLKILVTEDSQGKVWISYNSPAYLKERHGLPENLMSNIGVVQALAAAAGA